MRTFLATLLLSSVLLPAAASADPSDGESRAERRAAVVERAREAREQRTEQPRSERRDVQRRIEVERPQPVLRSAPDGGEPTRAQRFERAQEILQQRREASEGRASRRDVEQRSRDSVTDWRARERILRREQAGTTVPRELPPADLTPEQRRQRAGQILGDNLRERRAEREAERRAERDRSPVARPPAFRDLRDRGSVDSFRHSWRRDHRYDWRRHRDRNRHLFHFGWYYDPFGWGYRRWNIGWNIWPSYWSDRYWLRDPWQWRLPTVYGSYRWIRYYDDALLVDLRTGRVVDVIYDVFW
ncbi:RcnB family protein [Sphingomonas arenae]|uniref:RcnB family protein n=1 Tax=Sphingomonas arenae TaxID=2812555 RepID=UPI001967D046|nr:RcnB family protein [Sphingomonas arenae]